MKGHILAPLTHNFYELAVAQNVAITTSELAGSPSYQEESRKRLISTAKATFQILFWN